MSRSYHKAVPKKLLLRWQVMNVHQVTPPTHGKDNLDTGVQAVTSKRQSAVVVAILSICSQSAGTSQFASKGGQSLQERKRFTTKREVLKKAQRIQRMTMTYMPSTSPPSHDCTEQTLEIDGLSLCKRRSIRVHC